MVISARRIFLILMVIAGTLLVLHIGLQAVRTYAEPGNILVGLSDRFNLDHEASIPTWFSQTVLLVAAGLAWLISCQIRALSARMQWRVIAFLLLAMSIDEGASFHETIGVALGQSLGFTVDLGVVVLRDWVILGLCAVGLIAVLLRRFIGRLPARTRWTLVVGAATFLSGAVLWESLHFTTFGFMHNDPTFLASLSVAIEEGLEMLGSVIIVYALAHYLQEIPKQKPLFTISDRIKHRHVI